MRNPQLVRWTCGFLKIPNRHLPLSLWRQDLVSVLWSVRLSSCQLQEWQLGGRKLNSLQDLDCVVAITPLYSTKLGHRPTLTNVLKCYALTASLSVGDGTLSWSCYRRPKSQIFFWAAVLCLSSHSHVIMWGTGVDWILRWACNAESILYSQFILCSTRVSAYKNIEQVLHGQLLTVTDLASELWKEWSTRLNRPTVIVDCTRKK